MPPKIEAEEGHALVAADAPAAQSQPSFVQTLPMLLFIFGIFYFLLIRPQNKQRNEHQKLLAGLKKGDAVITEGGIVGRIWEVRDDRVVVDLGSSARMTVMKESIQRMDNDNDASNEKSASDKTSGKKKEA